MITIEYAFNLIKEKRPFLNNIENYKIKISNSNNFKRENLIGIYKIRQYTAEREGNHDLAFQIANLVSKLENYSEEKLRLVTIWGNKYYGIFYLCENYDRIIGYLESENDKNINVVN